MLCSFSLFSVCSLFCFSEMASSSVAAENEIIESSEIDVGIEIEINSGDKSSDDDEAEIDWKSYRIEFLDGDRLDSKLLYVVNEEQLYRRCTKHKQIGYWYRCRLRDKDKCSVRVFYEFASNLVVKSNGARHSHGKQSDTYETLTLKSSIKTDVTKLSTVRSQSSSVSEVFYRRCRE